MRARAHSPARAFDEALLRHLAPAIERVFRELPSAEVNVLRLRFGIGARRLSQRATAHRLAVSVGTVRRIERRALRDLRALSFPGDVPRCRTVPRGVLPPRRPVGSAAPHAAHAADEPAQLDGC